MRVEPFNLNGDEPKPSVLTDEHKRDRMEAIKAYDYLRCLFRTCAPQCEPLPDLLGLCTQIDNLIAGYRIKLGELPDPSTATSWPTIGQLADGES